MEQRDKIIAKYLIDNLGISARHSIKLKNRLAKVATSTIPETINNNVYADPYETKSYYNRAYSVFFDNVVINYTLNNTVYLEKINFVCALAMCLNLSEKEIYTILKSNSESKSINVNAILAYQKLNLKLLLNNLHLFIKDTYPYMKNILTIRNGNNYLMSDHLLKTILFTMDLEFSCRKTSE